MYLIDCEGVSLSGFGNGVRRLRRLVTLENGREVSSTVEHADNLDAISKGAVKDEIVAGYEVAEIGGDVRPGRP